RGHRLPVRAIGTYSGREQAGTLQRVPRRAAAPCEGVRSQSGHRLARGSAGGGRQRLLLRPARRRAKRRIESSETRAGAAAPASPRTRARRVVSTSIGDADAAALLFPTDAHTDQPAPALPP